jgi:hypothetical protein
MKILKVRCNTHYVRWTMGCTANLAAPVGKIDGAAHLNAILWQPDGAATRMRRIPR